jgi:kinesin family protein C2/C3
MSGPPDDFGVNTRALVDLFDRIAERAADFRDSISVSLLEVYNEEIRDLLVDARTAGKLEVKQGEFGNYVPGLTTVPVSNVAEVIEVLALGDKNRSSATTNMNEHSSRSHMMLTVSVQSENASSGVVTRGKLNLVDLAGSERIDKSGATVGVST